MVTNSVNIDNAGLVSFDGSSVFTGITPTQHAVQVGAATAASLTQLVGSDNQVIQGHTGADPTFTATPNFTSASVVTTIPVSPNDLTSKTYVDLIASGFTIKLATQAGTTANLNATYSNGAAGVGATLTNAGANAAFAVDGYSASLNDRILVKDQTAPEQNGIYSVTTVGDGSTPWVLTRTTDYDTTAQIIPGTLVPVVNGTVNASTIWLQTATVATIGTDPILFNEFVFGPGNFLLQANNLSDVASASSSRSNLGLTPVAIATPSQYAIEAGGAGNTLVDVTPSATSGVPLISQGSAATPVFGTAVVAGGGTGSTSFNTKGVVISGATSTSSLNSVSLTDGQLVIGSTAGSPAAATLTAGAGISITNASNSITVAGSGLGAFTWSDGSGTFSASSNKGYFLTSASSPTLPSSPSNGDEVDFIVDTASTCTVSAAMGQTIQIGSATSLTAVSNTATGDALQLVYKSSSSQWLSKSAPQGVWFNAFSPLDIAGLVLWLDGNDPNGNGSQPAPGKISSWVDKSGTGNSFSQGTGANQPSFVASVGALNNLGAVQFTAASNTVMTGSTTSFVNGGAARTQFYVFVDNNTANFYILAQYGQASNSHDWALFLGQSPGLATLSINVGGINATTTSMNNGQAYIYEINYAGSSIPITSAVVTIDTTVQSLSGAGTPNTILSTFTIGNGGANAFDGYLAEVIYYNGSLTSPQESQVYNYLASKWGI